MKNIMEDVVATMTDRELSAAREIVEAEMKKRKAKKALKVLFSDSKIIVEVNGQTFSQTFQEWMLTAIENKAIKVTDDYGKTIKIAYSAYFTDRGVILQV